MGPSRASARTRPVHARAVRATAVTQTKARAASALRQAITAKLRTPPAADRKRRTRGQRVQAALGAPGQVTAEIGFGVLTGGALEAGQVRGHCKQRSHVLHCGPLAAFEKTRSTRRKRAFGASEAAGGALARGPRSESAPGRHLRCQGPRHPGLPSSPAAGRSRSCCRGRSMSAMR
jgi:hypothetical protein